MSECETSPATAVIEDLAKFEPSALKHVEVTEKATLPSVEGKCFFCINYFFFFFCNEILKIN